MSEGILADKGPNNDWVEVRADYNGTLIEILVPNDLVEEASHLYVPNRVMVDWVREANATHPTATNLLNLRPLENNGETVGYVQEKGVNNDWIEIASNAEPLRRYVPQWTNGGYDPAATALIAQAEIGSEVRATWTYDERIRLVSLEKIEDQFPPPSMAEIGIADGILVGKGPNNEWVEVREDGNGTLIEILVPNDLVLMADELRIPNRVVVNWNREENATHPIATSLVNLRPGENQGMVTGHVVDKWDDNWIEISSTEQPLRRYVPRWINGQDDPIAGNLIREAEIGSEVMASWYNDGERVRLVSLEKIGGEQPLPPEIIEFEGVVKFIELEGGFHGIIRDGVEGLLPLNLPPELALDGQQVKGRGQKIDIVTIQQWGIPIDLENIETIGEQEPEPEPGTAPATGGTTEGVLLAKGNENDFIEVRLDGGAGVKVFEPRWLDGTSPTGGGFDQGVTQQIGQLFVGNRVQINWEQDEKLRVISIVQFAPESNEGTLQGIVIEKSDGWIEIQSLTDGLIERYSPIWNGGAPVDGGGLDKEMLIAISRAEIGGIVEVGWVYDERKRVTSLTGPGIMETDPSTEEETTVNPGLPEWLEQSIGTQPSEGQQELFGSVTGIVRDAQGEVVPRSPVSAHTPDGLLWLETETNAEGRFEFEHLSPRNWCFSAFPGPDESMARESEPVELRIVQNESTTVELQLGLANVYGRILAERPDGTHEALQDAHLWIFPDQNGDGLPDYEETTQNFETTPEEALPAANAGFVAYSDSRGYFSLDLPPGAYSMLTDLPSGTGLSEPEAISFVVGAGAEPLRLGNADVEGWCVVVEIPNQVIHGRVLDQEGSPASNAVVAAWNLNGRGWAESKVEIDGAYALKVGPGKWEVVAHPPFDSPADWSYQEDPEIVEVSGENPNANLNFTVTRRSAATGLKGRLLKPDGTSEWTMDQLKEISIEAWNAEGLGNWAQINSNGVFELALEPGHYDAYVWISPEHGYVSPNVGVIRVTAEAPVDLGDLRFAELSSKITGQIESTDDNEPLANLYVYAWNEEGDYASALTGVDGSYSLSVGTGFWHVSYEAPLGENDTVSPYLSTNPTGVEVALDQVVENVDFGVQSASRQIEGSLVGVDGLPLLEVDAEVYARSALDEDWFHVVAEAPVDARGRFQLQLPEGEYLLGVWLSPDSSFEMKEEVRVSDSAASANITLLKDDAVISGSFMLDGQPVTGLSGDVFAVPMDDRTGWRVAPIEWDGSYHLEVGAGEWFIDYHLFDWPAELPPFRPFPEKPLVAAAGAGEETTFDFELQNLSGSVTGSIVDADGNAVDGDVYVWIERIGITGDNEWFGLETMAVNGSFELTVPNGAKFAVGAYLGPTLRNAGHLEPAVVFADLRKQDAVAITLALGKRAEDEFIAGQVVDGNGTAVAGAFVYAWSEGGRFAEAESDAEGAFKLPVATGDVWRIGAETVTENAEGQMPYATEVETRIDLRKDRSLDGMLLTLAEPEFVVPDGIVESFDPREDFTAALPDGTKIIISANSLPVDEQETLVRLVAQPVVQGLVKTVNDRPLDYAYSIELFDSSGKEISQQFNKPVTIAIDYDKEDLERWGTTEEDLAISFFSSTKNAWEDAEVSTVDEQSSTIYARVDHFSQWAPTASPNVTPGVSVPSAISESTGVNDLGNGWNQLSWFGSFHDSGNGWVFHERHGWLFVDDTTNQNGNFWFHDGSLGWLWTGPDYYGPNVDGDFIYSSTEQSWMHYYYTADGERWFYLYSAGYWKSASGKTQVGVRARVNSTKGGSVTGSGTYSLGEEATLTAIPSDGYQFTGWSGDASGDSKTINVTVDGAKNIQADFEVIPVSSVINSLFE